MNASHAFPLTCPAGWPREAHPAVARFDTPLPTAGGFALAWELERMGATEVVISSNGELLRNGLFRANQPRIKTGVAVYFTLNGRQSCIPCDRWKRLQDNVQAVRLMVGALRGLDRWGQVGVVSAAFAGFEALPAGGSSGAGWWDVLDVPACASRDEIDAAYRRLARMHHPYLGGDEARMQQVERCLRGGDSKVIDSEVYRYPVCTDAQDRSFAPATLSSLILSGTSSSAAAF